MSGTCDSLVVLRQTTGGKANFEQHHELIGVVVAHVDDLLFTGNDAAHQSLLDIGKELGFGSVSYTSFTWCGKLIERDTASRLARVFMEVYIENLKPVYLSRDRRKELQAPLTASEQRQLNTLGGSLQ